MAEDFIRIESTFPPGMSDVIDPGTIAETYWSLVTRRDRREEVMTPSPSR
ncbi:hypothetical protein F4561_003958 [Lipingzhangella halophila]|uniref:Uncharacterized protein n=1 Tax=Lipingzhangella halophila TaxID=1783352 RepID=A0A7W7RJG8_9ACTN|nr:hypothetical protein [Lipingzhangella halophila]MBB4933138.1 hypothetical protein [Lipingzhangella halophila]